ncbi:hypothetical protein WIW49_02515 [Xanthomonas euroxanthea]
MDEVAVVADPWTLLGALDLQVRATEASLANVWIADYRNLGHGRHFWLADRTQSTLCIFLSSEGFTELDGWTRRELPAGLSTVAVHVPFEGLTAALASVAWSMHWIERQGLLRGRDPGRPGVPAFGERLYEGEFQYERRSSPTGSIDASLAAKLCLPVSAVEVVSNSWRQSLEAYKVALGARRLRAVAFDFDGTLVFSQHRWGEVPSDVADQLKGLVKPG